MGSVGESASSRMPVARHGRQRRRGFVVPLLKGVAIALAVLLVSGASIAAWALYDITHQISANAIDIGEAEGVPTPTSAAPGAPDVAAYEGGFEILVVGADNDASQSEKRWGDRDKAILNDVNILLHISADHSSAVAVSFPRDLVIKQPRCVDPSTGKASGAVSGMPLNAAFGRGGLACVVQTIRNLTGLPIQYAAHMTFDGVVAMTNAVGGIPVCLTEPIKDKKSELDLPAGTSVVSGDQALAFLRTRKSVGDGSDLSRIALQQHYMSSLVRTIKSDGTLTNPARLYGLAQAAKTHLKLSTTLANLNTMIGMALTLKSIDLDKLMLVQYPVADSPYDSNKVIPIKSTAALLMQKIKADAPFTADPDAYRRGVRTGPAPKVPAAPPTTGTATPTPPPPAAPAPVINGLVGQNADQKSCVVANR